MSIETNSIRERTRSLFSTYRISVPFRPTAPGIRLEIEIIYLHTTQLRKWNLAPQVVTHKVPIFLNMPLDVPSAT